MNAMCHAKRFMGTTSFNPQTLYEQLIIFCLIRDMATLAQRDQLAQVYTFGWV